MGHLAGTGSTASEIRFVDSGGTPGPAIVRLFHFLRAIRVALGGVPEDTVFHLNQASRLSTWRKFILVCALRVRRRTYVLHVHGGEFDAFLKGLNPVAGRLVGGMFRHAGAVVVLGEYWQGRISRLTGVSAEKFHVVPNAVPGPATLPADRTTPTVLFSGQLTRRKGILDLLEAWRTLPESVRTRLVLAGDVADPDGSIARALENTPDIETTGWIGPEQLRHRLSEASILALPSYGENLPMSLLDAMAWGLAPVVTAVGAVPEVVEDGVSGCIVPTGDPRALAQALESLLLDRRKRESIGRAARLRWEERYSLSGYRDRLDEVYEAALAAEDRSGS